MTRNVDAYADTYTAESSFEPYMVKYRRRLVLELIAEWRPDSILEIGCGMEPLFPHVGVAARHVVVEPAAKFAEHAARLAGASAGITVLPFPLEQCVETLRGQSFGLILASGVLHEVSNPSALLEQIRSIAEPHTKVHVNVPNSRSLHRQVGLHMGALRDFNTLSDRAKRLQQHTAFDQSSLSRAVSDAGFSILETGGYFVKPFTHDQMGKMMKAAILDDAVLDALYLTGKENPGMSSEIYVNAALP